MQDLRESVRLKKRGNRNRCGEEIDTFVILLRLSIKLIPKEIGNQTADCIYSYLECVLEYIAHLASRIILGETWEDAYKVSFADFWS